MTIDNPCRVCGLPVTEPSCGGPDLCPWCDCGIHRDRTPWTYREATDQEYLRRVISKKAVAAQVETEDADAEALRQPDWSKPWEALRRHT